MNKKVPIVFILGPSGAGKTTLAKDLESGLNFIHLDIDRADGQDGIDVENLRSEWNEYLRSNQAQRLANVIHQRTAGENKRGAILSFPSGLVLTDEHIREGTEHGIVTVILYGPRQDCINSFLEREKTTSRHLGINHWERNNRESYALFGLPEFAPYRILTFENGNRIPSTSLIEDVRLRVADIGKYAAA